MSFKKITSIFLLFSFVIVFLSTIVLYIAPPRSFASWHSWSFLMVSKGMWHDLHITIGFLFLIFLVIHVFYNFKLLLKYFKKVGSNFLTREFAIAAALIILSSAGTYYRVQPFSFVLDFGYNLKKSAMSKMKRPPFRHAEYSTIDEISRHLGLDRDEVISNLKNKGFKVEEGKSLLDIAGMNSSSPNEIFDAMAQ